MDAMTLIGDVFSPLAGKRLLDIGCGRGDLVRSLRARGAEATGVDPAADGDMLVRAGAEALPFVDAAFDGAIFLNSLHHVPLEALDDALAEAARVTGRGRTVVVIEPEAQGTFFAALSVIEDEMNVREAAQAAVMRSLRGGRYILAAEHRWVRTEVFPGVEGFLDKVIAADATRSAAIAEHRAAVVAAFKTNSARPPGGGYQLDQPIRAHVLTVA